MKDIISSQDIIEQFEALDADYQALLDEVREKKEELREFDLPDSRWNIMLGMPWYGRKNWKFNNSKPLHICMEERLDWIQILGGILFDELVDAIKARNAWDEEYREEYEALKSLNENGEYYSPDWKYGVPLIPEDYFKEYAMQLADDIGAIPDNSSWPLSCIDWEQAARELKMDYTAIEYQNQTYYVR